MQQCSYGSLPKMLCPLRFWGAIFSFSANNDGTLIYQKTILTKISEYVHVLAWSTSTLVVVIVSDTGEWAPETMSDIGRGEP
eukprot:COSAG05_NODE_10040_length_586_cov_5.735113_1_plen_82_part_00